MRCRFPFFPHLFRISIPCRHFTKMYIWSVESHLASLGFWTINLEYMQWPWSSIWWWAWFAFLFGESFGAFYRRRNAVMLSKCNYQVLGECSWCSIWLILTHQENAPHSALTFMGFSSIFMCQWEMVLNEAVDSVSWIPCKLHLKGSFSSKTI